MSSAPVLDVRTFTSPDWGENAYLARARGASSAVAVDPGGAYDALLRTLEAERLTLEAILLTHAHVDHIAGVAPLVRVTGAPVYLHPTDRALYDGAAQQARMFGVEVETPPPPTHELLGGMELRLAGTRFEVRDVPGHAPGHVIFYVADAGVAFVGDVVFQGSIGRTDLPGGNHRLLMAGIRDHVLSLPDDTVLYPGHGPATTVGQERVGNPFLTPMYGGGSFA